MIISSEPLCVNILLLLILKMRTKLNFSAILDDPQFALEIIITECVLSGTKGQNGHINALQHEIAVIENKIKIISQLQNSSKV